MNKNYEFTLLTTEDILRILLPVYTALAVFGVIVTWGTDFSSWCAIAGFGFQWLQKLLF